MCRENKFMPVREQRVWHTFIQCSLLTPEVFKARSTAWSASRTKTRVVCTTRFTADKRFSKVSDDDKCQSQCKIILLVMLYRTFRKIMYAFNSVIQAASLQLRCYCGISWALTLLEGDSRKEDSLIVIIKVSHERVKALWLIQFASDWSFDCLRVVTRNRIKQIISSDRWQVGEMHSVYRKIIQMMLPDKQIRTLIMLPT